MAVATRQVVIANPARKAKGRMTAKQIKFFGSKRQRNRKRKRTNAARKRRPAARKHRTRSKPNPAPRKRRRTTHAVAAPKKRRKRKNGSAKRRTRRKNPGEIFALVNPAKGHRKKVARTRRRRTNRRRSNAGSTRRHTRRPNTVRIHHRRRSNPAGMVIKDWLSLGAGAVVGSVGATQLPQLVLSTSNTGPVGYVANLAATGILAAAAHMLMRGNKALVGGIIAGGVGATIKRFIGDYSLLGSYGASLGMGDYLSNFNFPVPQSVGGAGWNQVMGGPQTGAVTAVNVAGASGSGMGYLGRPLY